MNIVPINWEETFNKLAEALLELGITWTALTNTIYEYLVNGLRREIKEALVPPPSTPKLYGLSLLKNKSFDKKQFRVYTYMPVPNKKLPYYRRNY